MFIEKYINNNVCVPGYQLYIVVIVHISDMYDGRQRHWDYLFIFLNHILCYIKDCVNLMNNFKYI